nr:integrase, catalytic region, zinc finger, CCHC-type, peptidase aspartic, catalytic [Tanacetum cinerariifolium]
MSKVKCYNCKKETHFAKDCKKAKVKDYNYYKINILLAKKDNNEKVLLAKDQAWMESNSDSNQEINANMVFMAKMEKVLSDSDESSSSAEETIAEIVQICLWIIDPGCSKHMTGNRAMLTNFVEKFLGTGLEVAFRKSTCFVRTEDGVDLLTGDRWSNLYTIAHNEVESNSSTCLLAKDSSS